MSYIILYVRFLFAAAPAFIPFIPFSALNIYMDMLRDSQLNGSSDSDLTESKF